MPHVIEPCKPLGAAWKRHRGDVTGALKRIGKSVNINVAHAVLLHKARDRLAVFAADDIIVNLNPLIIAPRHKPQPNKGPDGKQKPEGRGKEKRKPARAAPGVLEKKDAADHAPGNPRQPHGAGPGLTQFLFSSLHCSICRLISSTRARSWPHPPSISCAALSLIVAMIP